MFYVFHNHGPFFSLGDYLIFYISQQVAILSSIS